MAGAGRGYLRSLLCLVGVLGAGIQATYAQNPIPETPPPPAAGANSPIPPSPAFTSPDIQPTLADKLTAKPIALKKKLCATDPLLRPPFAAAPPETLKGMASGIRAVELDVPNRIQAVRYLGTVDCVTYPEARDMLIQTMQQDPSEEVRYEAVMALRLMLTHGCNLDSPCECPRCSQRKKVAMETAKYAAKPKKICPPIPCCRRHKTPQPKGWCAKLLAKEKRADCCRGCCSADAMNALSKVAYGHDGTCYFEPSQRIRDAAVAGMGLCEVYAPPAAEVPVIEESKPIQQQETAPPVVPPVEEAGPQARVIKQPAAIRQISGTSLAPTVAGLKGYCVVSLRSKEFVAGKAEFSTIYEEHTYYFSRADALAKFQADPVHYAPAFGGIDPVTWLQEGRLVEGQFLREFGGRFYLFESKENWEDFKAAPHRFTLDEATQASAQK